ncbi:MAG: cytochrome c peroxidase [Saprospiraceae bacterium]|jgi:cytochrome c peroxidase
MKNKVLLLIFLLSGVLFFSAFNKDKAAYALEEVQLQFVENTEDVSRKIADLVAASEKFSQSQNNLGTLQEACTNARLSFKKTEFLSAYLDEENIVKKINGAPLPKVEPHVPELTVIEPVGLQVLDEMIFTDDAADNSKAIFQMAQRLQKDYAPIANYQKKIKISHRHVFEGMRRELIRVFTLGVTGFDTPGSANAIPEAKAALSGVYEALNKYMPLIEEESIGLAIVIDARMVATLNYLDENQDFEYFDRMKFLKEHINPQYQLFYELQKELGIEWPEEVSDLAMPINYHTSDIFAADFLNADYYANLDFENSLTKSRRVLGQYLFFDPILSDDNARACASCHQPEKAFTDGLAKSLARGKEGTLARNSPSLVNVVYSDKYFWDIREHRLDRQMLHVIESKEEFNTDYLKIINKLKESTEYDSLFAAAYPEYPKYQISTYTISDALSQYVASLTDHDSDFDKYVRGEKGSYDEAAYRGFNLFMGKATCGTCHFAPTFSGMVPPLFEEVESEVLGIPTQKAPAKAILDTDAGRYANKIQTDHAYFYENSFKTVTIRNSELTAPYMHNGVYDTLEEVVDFYNRGGGKGMGMDLPHQTLPFDNLNLTKEEQSDLVAFMKTLTGDMSKFTTPEKLPLFDNKTVNNRKIGGEY